MTQAPTPLPIADDAARLVAQVAASPDGRLDWERIGDLLQAAGGSVQGLRHALACANAAFQQRFLAGDPAPALVCDRARLIDMVISEVWQHTSGPRHPEVALVAVGGYGRGELHPFSDVDLLVLLPSQQKIPASDGVSDFLTRLWDIGVEIRHSTRTPDECQQDAKGDLTVATTLMEARLLVGPGEPYERMTQAINSPDVWPSRSFFEAKLREEQARHRRYDDTGYNLEPDIKGSPGGLRDIQTIGWVTRRHFGTASLDSLVDIGLLTPAELRLLIQGRDFLWRIRLALHLLTGRREDRLLFDHQIKCAQLFGYRDASYMLAVEQFMQRYYRTVMDLSRLNEMLLQQFQEVILMNPAVEPEPLNDRFQVRNGFLQVASDRVFADTPSALLELFLLLQQHPDLKGVSAGTIALLQRSLHLVDDEFRQDPRNHALFLEILRADTGVTHELRRMNRYGLLGRYVPAFGRIVGRMQYDLFHAYTVDEHCLFVVSNLRRFALKRFDHEFPRCSEIMQSLPTPEIAYLAGLFHDIAKGRGGDHSELGAVDAEAFCLEHGMSRYDARLVAWLVREHLSLSLTAQKRDVSDPAVIAEFAALVGDELHLDYLYVLTVTDVRATNPKLWNSWRAQLFEELYSLAKQALRRGLENPIDREELIEERRTEARRLLEKAGLPAERIVELWAALGDEYFLRSRAEEIAWHTQVMAGGQPEQRQVLIDVHEQSTTGGSAVFVYAPRERHSFAIVTAALDELSLNIADARIVALNNGYSASTYVVLESNGEPIGDLARREQIRRRVRQALDAGVDQPLRVTRRPPRQVRMFSTPTLVTFTRDEVNRRTVVELVAGDRPGLLCRVGQILRQNRVAIQTAKIVTVGERAEDVLYVTDYEGNPLADALCKQLETELTAALESTR